MTDQHGAAVQSVERAIRILKSFSPGKPERGVNELSRELGLHKSTVSRLMSTLERGGLLARVPGGERYRLGVDLIGLAAQVTGYLDLREVARPILRALSEDCQETVNLVVLDKGEVVNLEQFVPPARQVKNIGWVGRRMPPHCTAAGKVLLAFLPERELERILPARLACFTPRTITDLEQFRGELAQVRDSGYAAVQEELEEGLNAIAAPILDYRGEVPAAAAIAGPAYRMPPDMFIYLADRLKETTAEISRRLGHSADR